jgi:hypothetical protein
MTSNPRQAIDWRHCEEIFADSTASGSMNSGVSSFGGQMALLRVLK